MENQKESYFSPFYQNERLRSATGAIKNFEKATGGKLLSKNEFIKPNTDATKKTFSDVSTCEVKPKE